MLLGGRQRTPYAFYDGIVFSYKMHRIIKMLIQVGAKLLKGT